LALNVCQYCLDDDNHHYHKYHRKDYTGCDVGVDISPCEVPFAIFIALYANSGSKGTGYNLPEAGFLYGFLFAVHRYGHRFISNDWAQVAVKIMAWILSCPTYFGASSIMSDDLESLAILPPCTEQITLLHQDADLLLINKPTRLLSVPGRHPLNRDSVIARLQQEYPDASIVHRLDFDTSGIMVIPLNKHALSHISRQFQARTVRKNYTAVVDGLVTQDEGVIDLPIAADAEHRPRYKICPLTGKPSVTEYQILSRDKLTNTTRVLLHPITGRSHQLRLHLQAIGHPILGCEFYAPAEALNKASRLLLHATDLSFVHPTQGTEIRGISEPPF
jgi:tRNA pseudouridine32 synthase/23S rRNA pseudouridine746 synthase